MSELGAIFGGGADHAYQQQASERILPAPAPVVADVPDGDRKDHGLVIPPIGLPGAAIVPEPFRLKRPEDED
jgi:hypothetical protein